jgi:hypothetical protein
MTDRTRDPIHGNPLLRRLLGPAGPEVTCDQCFELLDEYVELELAQATADEEILGMREHLEGCAACREEHDSLLAFVANHGPA